MYHKFSMGNVLDHESTKTMRCNDDDIEWFEEYGYDTSNLSDFVREAQEKIERLEKIQKRKREEIAERREELREEKEQLRDEEALYGLD